MKKNYIGTMKMRLADRLTEHLRSIKINFPGLSVAAYFNSSEHFIVNAYVSAIAFCANDT